MMADHWKSIANLLGAPGVDEPESETPAEPQAEEAPRSQPAHVQHPQRKAASSGSQPASVRQETSSTPAAPPAAAVRDDLADEAESSAAGSDSPAEGWHFDPNEPIPDEALSFKSLKPKPTRDRSPQSSKPTPSTPPAARSFSEPAPPQPAQASREAPRMPDRTEPEAPVAAAPSEAPPRRKSSWESLANMFNIKVDRSKPAEAAQPSAAEAPEPAQPRDSRPMDAADDDQPFPVFSEDRPARSNPALDAMFGEPPQPSKASRDNWGKPRVIDDLGWDDDDKDKPSSQPEESSPSSSTQDDEEPPRRGRRRRRGRRGRSDSTSSSASVDSPPSWGGLDSDTDDDTDDHIDAATDHDLHDDPWDEPESFELVRPDDLDGPGADSHDEPEEELSADGEVLRRSSRRRRRGRGSSDGERHAEETSSAGPASRGARRGRSGPSSRSRSDDQDGPVSFRTDHDESHHDDADDQLESPRLAQTPRDAEDSDSDDRGSRPRRRRRNGSTEKSSGVRRGPDSSSRAPAAERRPGRPFDDEGPIEDSFDDASLGPDGDEDEPTSGDGQRRSIPTWADSIAPLIQANTENRKRGDNRGAPRGRPRGRR